MHTRLQLPQGASCFTFGEARKRREIEARVEHARESHYSASDALHAAQSEMFAANSEVGRLETEIGHLRDSRARLETRLGPLRPALQWTIETI